MSNYELVLNKLREVIDIPSDVTGVTLNLRENSQCNIGLTRKDAPTQFFFISKDHIESPSGNLKIDFYGTQYCSDSPLKLTAKARIE